MDWAWLSAAPFNGWRQNLDAPEFPAEFKRLAAARLGRGISLRQVVLVSPTAIRE